MEKAFTLAEILITLGIIGVVAAMTIPTLIQNYNTRAWNTAATVFDRKLEEALKTMNTQQTLAGHSTTESFVEELSKHFKTNKICSNDKLLDCFSETVYWGSGEATPEEVDMSIIKTAKNFGQDDWNTNIVGVQFANGTSAMIAYNPITTGDNACVQDPHSNQVSINNCLAILYDTTGEKNPNTSGKDLRSNGNVTKLGKGCALEIGGTCYATVPFVPTPMTYEECAGENATSSGTSTTAGTYAQSLGIKNCYYANDYWAGAVKACGGTSKMPTQAQLTELANYVYNTTGLTTSYTSGLTLDTAKATSLGFTLNSSNAFGIWSGEENSEGNAYFRVFSSTYSRWYISSRNKSTLQTVCLGN